MADHPLRSATDRRLGRPLPHQLTNQTQAHPVPINLWRIRDVSVAHYEVLIPVSRGYPSARGRLPTRYSPVRRFPLNHATEVLVMSFSLDLHVLGTPPAFILSQDQTLNENDILRISPYDLSDLKLKLTSNVAADSILNHCLRNCRKLAACLFRFCISFCQKYIFDLNFCTMDFSKFAGRTPRHSLSRAFLFYRMCPALSTTFFSIFYCFFYY